MYVCMYYLTSGACDMRSTSWIQDGPRVIGREVAAHLQAETPLRLREIEHGSGGNEALLGYEVLGKREKREERVEGLRDLL